MKSNCECGAVEVVGTPSTRFMLTRRSSRIICWIAFLAIACPSVTVTASTFAQSEESRIDSFMRALAQRGQFNGSILIAEQGKVIYQNGFGKADFKRNIAFTPATPCYLASLTKPFTAMAIMILAERQKLSYGDPLSKYFQQFPPYADKITIRHLLNHTSGVPDYPSLGLERPGLTNQAVLDALIRQKSLRFSPGDRFEYSNSGYILLAMIIEKVSGQPLTIYLKKHIFDPLKMRHTYVHDVSRPSISQRARGYSRFGDDDDYSLLTVGDGGIFSTVQDLLKWDQALYTEALVRQSTLNAAFAPATLTDGSKR